MPVIRNITIKGDGKDLVDKFSEQWNLNVVQPFSGLPTGVTLVETNYGLNAAGVKVVPELITPGSELALQFENQFDQTSLWVVYNIVGISPLVNVFDNDCCPSINIVWINRLGGYENYIFSGKRQVYELEDGEAIQFKTYNLTKKNAQLNNIYRAVILNTGIIPVEHTTKLESLRNSIQAWVYDDTLPSYTDFADRFTPILVDRDSMIIRDTREKIVERTVRFIIAKEIVIQKQ
jgi:hypothetical protein